MKENENPVSFAIEITNSKGTEIVCYTQSERNAKLICRILHQMRGFFAEGFEEVTVDVRDSSSPVEINIDYTYGSDVKGVNTMNFRNAVEAMKLGNRVRRLSWKEGRYIWLDANYVLTNCYTGREDSVKHAEHWRPTLEDYEATDFWVVV